MTGQPGPGMPPYGRPGEGGWTWDPDANQRFTSENYFDPVTGMPRGPGSVPPSDVAVQWQAEHDRRVWEYRQNLMRSGSNYAQGALGLMQTFRPGGSAAIEAGQYNTLANIQLQRASMTQPLDLLGDWRRHQMAMNRQTANRQHERQLAVQGAAVLAQLLVGNYGGALGSIGGLLGSAFGGGQQQTPMLPGPAAPPPGYVSAPDGSMYKPGIGQPSAVSAPSAPGGPPGAAPQPSGTPGQAPRTAPSRLEQPQQQGQMGGAWTQPMQGQPGGAGAPAGGAGAPGGAGFGGAPGANGDFTPTAYAMAAAGQSGGDPLQTLAITRTLANELDQDPIWNELTIAIDERMRSRFVA